MTRNELMVDNYQRKNLNFKAI